MESNAEETAADAALTDLGALEALVTEEEQEIGDEAVVADVPEAAELEARPAREERGAAELHVPLEMYFRDLADVPVLTPEEELTAWKRIEVLELAWWRCAFSFPPMVAQLVDALVPRVQHAPEALVSLGELLRPDRAVVERFDSAVERASENLVGIDVGLASNLQRSGVTSRGSRPLRLVSAPRRRSTPVPTCGSSYRSPVATTSDDCHWPISSKRGTSACSTRSTASTTGAASASRPTPPGGSGMPSTARSLTRGEPSACPSTCSTSIIASHARSAS